MMLDAGIRPWSTVPCAKRSFREIFDYSSILTMVNNMLSRYTTLDFASSAEDKEMFLRNCWYAAGWSKDFAVEQLYAVTILNEPIVIYRKEDGAPAALQDRCCHRLAPLSMGRLEGENLRCMYHGLKFAPSGRCP
jgi:phenylpropionate dioxygenase-like ring-hydroxylating dioxygenase large terminal subunit